MQKIKTSTILEIVSMVTNVPVTDIISKSRKQEIVLARHISMYFSRFKTTNNLLSIALKHGKNNHATVIHACQNISFDIKTNKNVRETIQEIETLIQSQTTK